jgi:UDP-galactopyranose mutase
MADRFSHIHVVGAGFFGAVIAERIAEVWKCRVDVIDKRPHIGGNCWSEIDPETGVEYHKYGSHIFHTSDEAVWNYVTRFSAFNEYRHTVLTTYRGEVFTMPINLGTINQYYRRAMSPDEAKEFVRNEAAKENIRQPENLEEKAVSLIGRPLYEAFFRGYTMKQWEKDPKELSPDIITRLPVRYNYNHRYFSDKYEGIPLIGYGKLIGAILDHPRITLRTNCPWREYRSRVSPDDLVIYTGAPDEFFDCALGELEWRTVDFELERPACADYQGTTVMNYADAEVPFTRIHEFKHYHPERPDTGKTIIFKEYSRFAGHGDEPYYPVFTARNNRLHADYLALGRQKAPNVRFGGRLGLYKYLDMDDTVAEALRMFADLTDQLRK